MLMPEQDFGLMLYDFAGVRIGRQHLSEVVPSKFFHYLELGLPVLVSPELQAVAALVRRHDLGLVVPRSRVSRLAALLHTHIRRYPAWIRNLESFRTRFSMSQQVAGLESWYQDLARIT